MTSAENIRPGILERTIKEFGIRNLVRQEGKGRIVQKVAGQFGSDVTQYLYLLVPNDIKLHHSDKIAVSSFQGVFMGHIIGYDGKERATFSPDEILVDSYTHNQVQKRFEETKQKKNGN